MGNPIQKLKETFLEKQNALYNARIVLKSEFVGLDKIIDEIIDNASSWYTLHELQEKPVVINLWGLTGVGKSSLVNRLAELLKFEERYFRFDMGRKADSMFSNDVIEDLCSCTDESPLIIALDEFQHNRTVSGPFRQERESEQSRKIWDLIDSGKLQYVDWKSGLWSFEGLITKLRSLLQAGVMVEKGTVVSGKDVYSKEMQLKDPEEGNLPFVPESAYENIIDFAGDRLKLFLYKDVREILLSLNGDETITFLIKVFKLGQRSSEKNFSKALIFIMGNLDEAYTMSSNFSPDMDADEFHKQSLKLTVPMIKSALQSRFRDEQIARLGNIHIIYPAFSRPSYEKIISVQLSNTASILSKQLNISVNIDQSLAALVYREGVYPTQGVRPIFTTIHHVFKSKLSFFISEILANSLDVDLLDFSVEENKLCCTYRKKRKVVLTKKVEIPTTLEDARKCTNENMQAIIAVHESGHAVISSVLLNTIPEVIFSVTSDSDKQGFVLTKLDWQYISRKEIIPRIAMQLGGYVAEEMIFGKENLTAGASSDIESATTFLSKMYKSHGMGELPITCSIPINEAEDSYHDYNPVEKEIKDAITTGLQLAQLTLEKEKKLLLLMSEYLSDHRVLRKEEIRDFIIKHKVGTDYDKGIGDTMFYRNSLKQQLMKVKENNRMHQQTISLNKIPE